jgi:hypothetical protein
MLNGDDFDVRDVRFLESYVCRLVLSDLHLGVLHLDVLLHRVVVDSDVGLPAGTSNRRFDVGERIDVQHVPVPNLGQVGL